jgi:hypothetical protein
MLTGPQSKKAHRRTKFKLDIFKNLLESVKAKILDVLLTGPREPRYGSELWDSQVRDHRKYSVEHFLRNWPLVQISRISTGFNEFSTISKYFWSTVAEIREEIDFSKFEFSLWAKILFFWSKFFFFEKCNFFLIFDFFITNREIPAIFFHST